MTTLINLLILLGMGLVALAAIGAIIVVVVGIIWGLRI